MWRITYTEDYNETTESATIQARSYTDALVKFELLNVEAIILTIERT